MLTLEMEVLTGVFRASLVDQSGAEWPPHPDRVFSALVQAWGDGGEEQSEREALTWLESLDPSPTIEASEINGERDSPVVYVPPNDSRSTDVEILPEARRRQPRQFRAVVPLEPLPLSGEGTVHVRFRWEEPVSPSHLAALKALAHRVSSVGHSSSLVRLLFRDSPAAEVVAPAFAPSDDGPVPMRVTYAGRFEDLTNWYSSEGGKQRERPRVRATVRYARTGKLPEPAVHSCFAGSEEWIVLATLDAADDEELLSDNELEVPDILAFPRVARRIRDALMRLDPHSSPEIICGHKTDGTPSESPHLAIVPLANVGWEYSNGVVLGVGLVPPRSATAQDRRLLFQSVNAWMSRGGLAHLTRRTSWRLRRVADVEVASLRPERYCRAGRCWASVTPVFLDRFLKGISEAEEAESIARACTNIGLEEPIEVEIHKHSAARGAESAYPARGRAHRPDWNLPEGASYRDKPRRHVVVRFRNPVRGPLLLGAGRYHGLGLFLPIGAVDGELNRGKR